ncbi:integrin beta-2-like [Amphiura filiformis]|uniref:integrin beta-2-like n=1 Tax=Amphiura filiformis TaxID=82378 RepID=UPI003B20E59E
MERSCLNTLTVCLFAVTIVLSLMLFSTIAEESPLDSTWNICVGAKHCSECIERHSTCAWCLDSRSFRGSNDSQCDTYDNLYSRGLCSNITFPENSILFKENTTLSDADDSIDGHAVQVTPQKVAVKLRIGQSMTFRVSIRQAADYPLDLYYLMDLSKSLSDDLESLHTLGRALVRRLRRLTCDLRLGFGAFVDKTILPFVLLDQTTCHHTSCCKDCVTPFSYKNEQPLTNNTRRFFEKIYYSKVSTNLDTVEGGFDALLQAAVCKKEIGWRDRARRMLVFVTDAGFHIAGDGKLAGIIRPNDGLCHMDVSHTEYNQSIYQDYPSVGQLNEILQRNNIVPVFAVPDGRLTLLYRELAKHISGAKVGIMAENSNNVIDLVERQFQAITSEVQLTDDANEFADVSYTSYCTDGRVVPGSSKCSGLRLTETVHFDVKVTARKCTPGWKKQKFYIRPLGFDEQITVQLKVICKCDCEKRKKRDLKHCTNGNGILACGQCMCDPGRYGDECQCSGKADLDADDVTLCIGHNSTIPCHGRGQCFCGECICNKRLHPRELISGKYCECDNFSCDRHQGELCGGPGRGECECDAATGRSKCRCKSGYAGSACGCRESTKYCETPSGLLCNGFGECKCGRCQCYKSSPFFGPTCQQCPTCFGLCSSFRECVLCKVFDSGLLSSQQCQNCSVDIQTVESIKNVTVAAEPLTLCQHPVDSNCTIQYGYTTKNDGAFVVYVQKTQACREIIYIEPPVSSIDFKWIIMSIVLLVLLAGLMCIMLVRLCIYCQDSNEYATFRKETANSKWTSADNPLFRRSISTYVNPVHGVDDINQNLL